MWNIRLKKITVWETEFLINQENCFFLFTGWYRKKMNITRADLQSRLILYITLFVINSRSVGGVGSVLCLDSVPLVTCYCERESHFLLFFLGELLMWVRSGTSVNTVRLYVFSTEGSLILVSSEACAGIFLFILLLSASMHTKETSQHLSLPLNR